MLKRLSLATAIVGFLVGSLAVGLLAGSAGQALASSAGGDLGPIYTSLERIVNELKNISRNVDDQRTVCECRCK
jgi:hypothetical protein